MCAYIQNFRQCRDWLSRLKCVEQYPKVKSQVARSTSNILLALELICLSTCSCVELLIQSEQEKRNCFSLWGLDPYFAGQLIHSLGLHSHPNPCLDTLPKHFGISNTWSEFTWCEWPVPIEYLLLWHFRMYAAAWCHTEFSPGPLIRVQETIWLGLLLLRVCTSFHLITI